MTDLRKAAEMALEALDWYVKEDDVIESMAGNEPWVEGKRNAEKAIQTLRQALAEKGNLSRSDRLAQPKQEPVASCNGMPAHEGPLSKAQHLTPDLDAPLTLNGVALYPKKEWIGLTRRELDIATLGLEDLSDCYKAIEAKLKEKNT